MRLPRPVVAALALALAGCPPRAPPPDLSLDPAELLGQVRAAQERTRSVRGEARIRIEARGFSGTVPALVAAEKPDRILVRTLDFFGNTVAVLAAADGVLSLYDARERVLYRGAATPENLARLVPVPLSPADLAVVLCGSAPLLAGAATGAEAGRGFVSLALAGDGSTQTLRVGPGAAVLRASRRGDGAGGAGTYELAFDGLDRLEGQRFPAEVALSADAPRVRMRLAWVDVEPGAALDPAVFSPPTPRGARLVDLEDAAAPAGLFPEAGRPGE
jgi:hypothetical protein